MKNYKRLNLRFGWTTGCCATAATKAALSALWGGIFPKQVSIVLPDGQRPNFKIAHSAQGDDWAEAGIIKDAGDDPDVTHGVLVIARVRASSGGIIFRAGAGVGVITKLGMPLAIGEPAINPKPRQFMRAVVQEMASRYNCLMNVEIMLSIPDGKEIALKTWNGRLGIKGGLSILGTTGIVRPFSCSAWIASIHRGIDVARAAGLSHVAGCTGATSTKSVQNLYGLSDYAMLDMGDFVGGVLKYLGKNPVERLTIGGGVAKMTKLAQGARDLHSARFQVDFAALNRLALSKGLSDVGDANTVLEAVERAGNILVQAIAVHARQQAIKQSRGRIKRIGVVVINRGGQILGQA